MNRRIENAFANARAEGRGAFVAYLTAGFPTLEAFEAAADALVAGGADILEIGVPFSDPFADGGVIRKAAYRALEGGMTLAGAIAASARIRSRHPETGIVLFSYYNPIFSYGVEKFADAVAAADVDAVLAVDLPLEVPVQQRVIDAVFIIRRDKRGCTSGEQRFFHIHPFPPAHRRGRR